MKTPYLSWITSNLKLYDYDSKYSYDEDDLVTYENRVYKSMSKENKGNDPINSQFWIRII